MLSLTSCENACIGVSNKWRGGRFGLIIASVALPEFEGHCMEFEYEKNQWCKEGTKKKHDFTMKGVRNLPNQMVPYIRINKGCGL